MRIMREFIKNSFLQINKRLFAVILLLAALMLSGCEGTTITTTEKEKVSKVYEIEAGSEEELAEKIENLPEEITEDGKTYHKRGDTTTGDDVKAPAKEGTASSVVETKDPLVKHKADIAAAMQSVKLFIVAYYLQLAIAIIAAAGIIIAGNIMYHRYDLWW